MRDDNAIMREALLTIRCELDRRGIPLKVCAGKGGFSYSTFLSWFPLDGTPQIPCLSKLPGLAKALPDDLLSYLVPDGFHIVRVSDDVDHDEFSEGLRDYLDTKEKAHRTDSPAGPAICPTQEKPILDAKAAGLKAVG